MKNYDEKYVTFIFFMSPLYVPGVCSTSAWWWLYYSRNILPRIEPQIFIEL
jgi:hypothetical protein